MMKVAHKLQCLDLLGFQHDFSKFYMKLHEANDANVGYLFMLMVYSQKFMTDLRQKTHEKLGQELLYRKL